MLATYNSQPQAKGTSSAHQRPWVSQHFSRFSASKDEFFESVAFIIVSDGVLHIVMGRCLVFSKRRHGKAKAIAKGALLRRFEGVFR